MPATRQLHPIAYVKQVTRVARRLYGVTAEDLSLTLERIAAAHAEGQTPEALVRWTGDRLGLTTMDEARGW